MGSAQSTRLRGCPLRSGKHKQSVTDTNPYHMPRFETLTKTLGGCVRDAGPHPVKFRIAAAQHPACVVRRFGGMWWCGRTGFVVLPERLDRSGRAGDLQVEEGYFLLSPQILF